MHYVAPVADGGATIKTVVSCFSEPVHGFPQFGHVPEKVEAVSAGRSIIVLHDAQVIISEEIPVFKVMVKKPLQYLPRW